MNESMKNVYNNKIKNKPPQKKKELKKRRNFK